jgi:hypothetical protein
MVLIRRSSIAITTVSAPRTRAVTTTPSSAEQEAVLTAERLALGTVHHDDRPTALAGHGPKLGRGGKVRASVTMNPRPF